MPTDLIRFPGDLITADLWNRMLAMIDGINGRLDAQEALVVPDVVGDLFPSARDEIARARLDLNAVFDVDGTRGDPDDPAMASRIVLTQNPAAEARVASGTRMTLLITAPKVAKANAPTISAVNPATNAQIGQPLEITGTNFTGNVRVIIRNTELASGLFTIPPGSTTQIQIPKVPPFEGSPTPGTTKDIPITVRNDAGDATVVVKFTEATLPAARPTITTVRMIDKTTLRLMGTSLVQAGQDTSVTMGGETRTFQMLSDGSLIITMPTAMSTGFNAVSPAVFDLLQKLDERDVFKVTITTNPVLDFNQNFNAGDTPIAARAIAPTPAFAAGAPDQPFAVAPGAVSNVILRFSTTMKLYLILSSRMATAAQTGTPQVVGNIVTLNDFQGRPIFSVDVSKLQDFSVVVKVGDKNVTFPVKFGSVPDTFIIDRPIAVGPTFGRGGLIFQPQ